MARARARHRSRCLRARRGGSRGVLGRLRRRARVDRSRGRRCSTGSRRTRSGSSAAGSTRAPTASTATSAPPRRNKAAIIWEGEPGDRRTLTYFDLHREVCQFANVLKSLGVRRATASRSTCRSIPELAIAMLACARIGAVHSVVFGGFSAESLRDRINDAQATVLITADGGYRRGQIVPLKQTADEALDGTPSIQHVVVVQREPGERVPRAHQGRPRPLVPPADAGRVRRVPAGADGRRGHALHPLHVRHDRQAEGHRAHDRRLPRRAPTPRRSGSSICATTTSTGARPTSAG